MRKWNWSTGKTAHQQRGHKDADEALSVGKAKNLRSRVHFFSEAATEQAKVNAISAPP